MDDFPDSIFNTKDYLISTYGEYNYALAKTINELTGNSYSDVLIIKLSIILLNKLVMVTGKGSLPRPGIYLKSRLAKAMSVLYTTMVDPSYLYNTILAYWFNFDQDLIKKCVAWNYLNIKNFGTNKFSLTV